MSLFVQYGGGNIGRGFLGPMFSGAGYAVQFIDVNRALIEALNERGRYIQTVVSDEGEREVTVENVSGVDGTDTGAVARAIAQADVMSTAVGVNVLPRIAPALAEGFRLRMRESGRPLDMIICENLVGADRYLRELVTGYQNTEETEWMRKNIGFVEASIGRMVPVMTEEMQRGDPLRICVEPYAELPVDADALRAGLPEIPGLHAFSPFEFYIQRKLYLHNMSHSLVAYLGALKGCTYLYEAVGDPTLKLMAVRAMNESKSALCARFGADRRALDEHADDLLLRFANRSLRDTVRRVGRDTLRKLAPGDRYAGTIGLCADEGVLPVYICAGAAAALFFDAEDDLGSREIRTMLQNGGVRAVIQGHMGLPDGCEAGRLIGQYYRLLASGRGVGDLLALCEHERRAELSGKTVV